MIEVWLVTLLIVLFLIGAALLWMRVWIIDIFKAINESKTKKYTKTQWILIWLFALFILIFAIVALVKWGVNLS
jgi:ABC-type Fe3+ transport system permease subunit